MIISISREGFQWTLEFDHDSVTLTRPSCDKKLPKNSSASMELFPVPKTRNDFLEIQLAQISFTPNVEKLIQNVTHRGNHLFQNLTNQRIFDSKTDFSKERIVIFRNSNKMQILSFLRP